MRKGGLSKGDIFIVLIGVMLMLIPDMPLYVVGAILGFILILGLL